MVIRIFRRDEYDLNRAFGCARGPILIDTSKTAPDIEIQALVDSDTEAQQLVEFFKKQAFMEHPEPPPATYRP
jgi:hypothetical protein